MTLDEAFDPVDEEDEDDGMHCKRCGDSLLDNWGEDGNCRDCTRDLRIKKYDEEN